MDASIKCKQLGLTILRAIKNLQISIQGIQKKNSTCGGYDGPRAFAKRGPLTQLEKTPGTLTPPLHRCVVTRTIARVRVGRWAGITFHVLWRVGKRGDFLTSA